MANTKRVILLSEREKERRSEAERALHRKRKSHRKRGEREKERKERKKERKNAESCSLSLTVTIPAGRDGETVREGAAFSASTSPRGTVCSMTLSVSVGAAPEKAMPEIETFAFSTPVR